MRETVVFHNRADVEVVEEERRKAQLSEWEAKKLEI